MKFGIFTLAILLFAVPAPASSQPAASDDLALLTVNQYRRLLRRDLMDAESKRLKAEGKLADALKAADEVVTIEREVFGRHQRVVDALSRRASLEMDLQDFAAARKTWEQIIEVELAILGPDHKEVMNSRKMLVQVTFFAGLTKERFAEFQRNVLELGTAGAALQIAKSAAAAKTVEAAHAKFKKLLKGNDLLGAIVDAVVGIYYAGNGFPAEAVPLLSGADAVFSAQVAEDYVLVHEATDIGHKIIRGWQVHIAHELGQAALRKEDFPSALSRHEDHLKWVKRLHGDESSEAVNARLALDFVRTLAAFTPKQRIAVAQADESAAQAHELRKQQRVGPAEAKLTEALARRRNALGQRHFSCGELLTQRGKFREELGKKSEALDDYYEAFEVLAAAKGPRHVDSVHAADLWGEVALPLIQEDLRKQDPAAAIALGGRLLKIREQAFPEGHWKLVDARRLGERIEALRALAPGDRVALLDAVEKGKEVSVLLKASNYKAAAESWDKTQAAIAKIEPKKGDAFMLELSELPFPYSLTGPRLLALPLYHKARETTLAKLGEQHPRTIAARRFLGIMLRFSGKEDEARKEFEAALAAARIVTGEKSYITLYLLGEIAFIDQFQGRLIAAENSFRKAMEGLKEIAGPQSNDYAQSLLNLGVVCRLLSDHKKAEPVFRELVEVRRAIHGAAHSMYADSLNSLGFFFLSKGDYAEAEKTFLEALAVHKKATSEKSPAYATVLANLADLYRQKGDLAKADEWLKTYLDNRGAALGRDTVEFANVLHSLGDYYASGMGFRIARALGGKGDVPRTRAILTAALEIRRKRLPAGHVDIASTLHALGVIERLGGNYAKAEEHFLQALAIRQKSLPDPHRETATTLNSLAVVYQQTGDFVRAESLQRQAVNQYKKLFGEQHPQVANNLANLARIAFVTGDVAKAEPAFRQVMAITKATVGDRHPNFANSISELAALYLRIGSLEQAEQLFHHASRLHLEATGPKSPLYARSLEALANTSVYSGQYEQAASLASKAVALLEEREGDGPDVAFALIVLARVQLVQGDLDAAEKSLQRVRGIQGRIVHPRHPQMAELLAMLGQLYDRRGQPALAAKHLKEALDISMENLRLTAGMQSERQQIAMAEALRVRLDAYLSVAERAGLATEQVYEYVLAWKGAVFARQQRQRLLRGGDDPKLAELLNRLQATSAELATLANVVPEAKEREAWRKQFEQLSAAKEEMEGELARVSGSFKQLQQQSRRSAKDVLASLPEGAALVDFLEFEEHRVPKDGRGRTEKERRLIAFVLQPGQPPRRLDLGPSAPIEEHIDHWRADLKKRALTHKEAGLELRRLVWLPVRKALGDVKTVLLSTDGALSRLPFPALPGAKEGSYLLEETAMAIVAVPQLLPDLLGPAEKEAAPSLLLVGDVDFGNAVENDIVVKAPTPNEPASKGTLVAARAGGFSNWVGLPGTKDEVLSLQSTFAKSFPSSKAKVLQKDMATEAALRIEAPRHRWLHLATHGFFAPPRLTGAKAGDEALRAELVGFHPGLLSGVVLAGANRPPQPGRDDNVLTALEVAELDLRQVSLAVLSACETGLGKVAGGEGVLGLQRAFQVSGVRTVVSSLWSVPDQPTRVLMERFYANLWEKKMGKLEALREAQTWMLREGVVQPGLARSLVLDDAEPADAPQGRLPPYFWAAFVLSGDWR